ncbi:M23 family metallopeptidase [Nocardioides sp. LS1]|uniref:M23 family metallopeptidase n=1 Tax=Nocardioides sp. LS1 TaxID=1027620 RepID=UPI000FFA8CD7|nr:M23 family metallopeptidase [Nocardioides sp. LS1]GCD92186.1 hypothetical protein NLS1_41920 [Nocardioides sp. LS1]
MGNHRAERRGSSRRPSETPTAELPVVEAVAPAAPARSRRAAAEATTVSRRATEQAPARQAAGKRRAEKATPRRSGSRGPLFRGLPSAPILIGITALAVSAGGAVVAADPALTGSDTARLSQASALSGLSGTDSSSLLDGRKATVSRDSRRDAQADAANAELVQQAEAQMKQRNAALAQFAKLAEAQAAKLKLNAWVLPVQGYHLTARFGEYSGLWSHFHTGLDFAAPSGTPIVAVAGGVVTSTGYDGSYGNKTVITLDDGTELWFCHQTSYAVSPGETVRAGQLIGYVGATGNVTGPHLHLEVRPGGGDPVDPYQALVVHGLQP